MTGTKSPWVPPDLCPVPAVPAGLMAGDGGAPRPVLPFSGFSHLTVICQVCTQILCCLSSCKPDFSEGCVGWGLGAPLPLRSNFWTFWPLSADSVKGPKGLVPGSAPVRLRSWERDEPYGCVPSKGSQHTHRPGAARAPSTSPGESRLHLSQCSQPFSLAWKA